MTVEFLLESSHSYYFLVRKCQSVVELRPGSQEYVGCPYLVQSELNPLPQQSLFHQRGCILLITCSLDGFGFLHSDRFTLLFSLHLYFATGQTQASYFFFPHNSSMLTLLFPAHSFVHCGYHAMKIRVLIFLNSKADII